MFNSISSCTPNSTVTTEFTSTRTQTFDIWSNVSITVNGASVTTRPITLANNDIVTATVTAPSGYLSYQFYPYYLDNRLQNFAVVNRNLYNPTVKSFAARRRWYNYIQRGPTTSIAGVPDYMQNNSIGYGKSLIDVEKLHIVLDPLKNAAILYSTTGEAVSRLMMPAGPIDYRKITSISSGGGYRQDLLLLGNDGKVYRVVFNTQYYESSKFTPAATPNFILDDLPFQEDIPGSGSLLDVARRRFLNALFPVITAMDVRGTNIWIAGGESVYVLNLNFALQSTISVPGEKILDLTCVNNDAVVVTESQKVIYVGRSGTINLLYSSSAIGTPATLADGARVAVPDSDNQRILIFTGNNSSYAIWPTPDFVPAYCRLLDGYLYATGHDSNLILQYYADNTYVPISFENKVTLASAIGDNVMAIHYLGPAVTLNMGNVEKVIPFTLESRTGPVTHIGTEPRRITMLGRQGIYPKVGHGLTYWANGISDAAVNSDDWFTVSYKGAQNGNFRSPVILGDTAFDYDVEVISSTFLTDYYEPTGRAIHKITPTFGVYPTPDSGTIDEGFTGPIPLGFNIKTYGNIYGNIYVHTNGTITFTNSVLQQNPVFGSFPIDAIYAEPENLYQGLPINNVDPLNITLGHLESYETPGVYYKDQVLGAFVGFRVRWVGTSWSSYPLGNTVPTTIGINNWSDIPVPSLGNINVGDYISGNNITVSSYVTAKVYSNITDTVYFGAPVSNYLLTYNTPSLRKYSNVYVANNLIGYVDNTSYTTLVGNIILATQGNTTIVDGAINPTVDTTWAFRASGNIGGAQSITTNNYSITALNTAATTNTVMVNATDYAAIMVNQTISSNSLPAATRIVSKTAIPRQYSITANVNTMVEGNTVQFTVQATQIALINGETFSYSVGGTVDSADFVPGTAMSGTITASGGTAILALTTEPNVSLEGTETITVTFTLEPSVVIIQSISLLDDGSPSSTTLTNVSNSLTYFNYYFTANNSFAVTNGDLFYLTTTAIDFGSRAPLSAVGSAINYVYNRINLFSGAGAGFSTETPVQFLGNFATVTNPQTLTANTAVLFKSNVPAPAYTYEVGFYTGGRFQYIELFYDNNRHSNTKTVGISSGDYTLFSSNATVSANTSYLFGSEIAEGRWQALGPGSFTKDTQGFTARYLDIIPSIASSSTETAYEFVIDQRIPTLSNIKLAIDYGRILLNGRYYTGLDSVRSGDAVKVTIPLGTNTRYIAPLVSIGDYQQAIPTIVPSLANTVTTSANVYYNQLTNTYVTSNVDIATSGLYYIPEYYGSTESGAGIQLTYTKISGGISTVLAGRYHNLTVGDQVMITNQLTSRRVYDTREIVLVGPHWHYNQLITASGSRFNDFNYLPLVNPFVRYHVMNQTGTQILEEPAYRSANITMTATVPVLTGTLTVDRFGVNLVVNGTTVGNTATVTTGSKVALEWLVPNYYMQDAIVYHVKTDVDGGSVRIPVGRWSINNRSILGATIIAPGSYIESEFTPTRFNPNLIFESLQSQYQTPGKLISTPAPQANFVTQPTRFSNTISSNLIAKDSLLLGTAMMAQDYYLPATVFTGLIAQNNTRLIFNSISGNVASPTVFVAMTLLRSPAASGNQTTQGTWYSTNAITGQSDTITSYFDNGNVTFATTFSATQFDSNLSSTTIGPDSELHRFNDENVLASGATRFTDTNEFDYVKEFTDIHTQMTTKDFQYAVVESNLTPQTDFTYTELPTEFTALTNVIYDPIYQDLVPEITEQQIDKQHNLDPVLPDYVDPIKDALEPTQFSATLIPDQMQPLVVQFTEFSDARVPEIISKVSYSRAGFAVQHYQDVLWEMDNFTLTGAQQTYIGAFADNGPAGDKVTYKGNPAWRGPFTFHERTYIYNKGSYSQQYIAAFFAAKYVSATAFQITGTAYWNYRIHFNTQVLFTPRSGFVWPNEWLVRGG